MLNVVCWHLPVIPVLRRRKREDQEFEAGINCTPRPCLEYSYRLERWFYSLLHMREGLSLALQKLCKYQVWQCAPATPGLGKQRQEDHRACWAAILGELVSSRFTKCRVIRQKAIEEDASC